MIGLTFDRIVSERNIRLAAVRHSVEERIAVVALLDTVETVVGKRLATVAEIGCMSVEEVELMDTSSVGVY